MTVACIEGYLTYHKEMHPSRTLPQACAKSPRGFLGEWAFYNWRGTPVQSFPKKPHLLHVIEMQTSIL